MNTASKGGGPTHPTWDALRAMPVDEVRRRAAIVADFTGVEPMRVDTAERLAWHDGGGQSTVWYFLPDGRILLLTFDHESPLNLYAEGTYADQQALFDGVPADLRALVQDRPENYESLNIVDTTTGATIHYAGGVFWFDGTHWHIADGLLTHCARESLDLFIESGLDYCLDEYFFDRPDFTAETVVGHRRSEGRYEDEHEDAESEELATLTKAFDRHPRAHH
ncbi:hypothetical protein DY218_09775 [Streptomyces triticagri]|uniref:Uncharacterized protein n=2 Tax=Streptomyces triticagri TaxID=2293568 RepID=A0A372M7K2_9ACTN|nr:hypothetical protein DY218_09775 [Streptomyces triticagri]